LLDMRDLKRLVKGLELTTITTLLYAGWLPDGNGPSIGASAESFYRDQISGAREQSHPDHVATAQPRRDDFPSILLRLEHLLISRPGDLFTKDVVEHFFLPKFEYMKGGFLPDYRVIAASPYYEAEPGKRIH